MVAPVPPILDTPRVTTYAGLASATGPFDVGFAIFGTGTDDANWVHVWLNGVRLTSGTDYSLTSPSGNVATLPRPITDARITLLKAGGFTGSLTILGAERPRRQQQFAEGRGVTARDQNVAISAIVARQREQWDMLSRMFRVPGGESISILPPAASRANMFLAFDQTGAPLLTASTAAVARNGFGAPATGLGNFGDTYVNRSNGDFYVKGTTGWGSAILNIIGPAGLVSAAGDGSVSAPGIAFANEPSSGLRRAGAGDHRYTILGTDVVQITASGLSITGTLAVSGAGWVNSTALAFGAVVPRALAAGSISAGLPMFNGQIVESHAGGALTVAIKTLAGADPSASDPVTFFFRDATAGLGDPVGVQVTAALSISVPSTKGAGFANGTPGRLWLLALNNAGSVELAVINCRSGVNVYPLAGWNVISTSAVSGATAAQTAYSTSARTNVPYATLGFLGWETGLTTAGTWDASPTRIQIAGPGTPLPGQTLQSARSASGALATTSVLIPLDDTIPQNTEGAQFFSQAITPVSAANLLRARANLFAGPDAATSIIFALFQDSATDALASGTFYNSNANVNGMALEHLFLAATTVATTLKIRGGATGAGRAMTLNGAAGTRAFGGNMNSFLEVQEIQA